MKIVPLGKLTSLVSSGSTPRGGANVYLDDGPVMLVRSQNVLMRELNLDEVAFITEEIDGGMKRTVVCKNDVLLNITGASIGRVSTFELDGVKANVNQHVCIIRPIQELLNHRYLMHFIAQPKFQNQIDSTQNGGTRQALTFSQIRNFQIPLPPLAEQRRIAAILDKADAIRRKRKQAIQYTDELRRAAFLDMFGDPVTNPKGWKVSSLNQVCEKITDGTHDTPERLEKGAPYITGKHIRPFKIDFENCDYLSWEDHKEVYKRCDPKLGDILYTNIGVNLGTAAMCEVDFEFSMKNVALLKPDRSLLASRYLENLLNSKEMKQEIVRIASIGGAQKFLSLNNIKDLIIPIPQYSLQKQFSRISSLLFQRLQTQNKHASSLDTLFNSLLQRAFRGEL